MNQDFILVLNQHLGRELNYQAQPMSFAFGTNYEYGAIHHFGGSPEMRPQNAAIPARPWLGVSDEDTEQIYQILGDFLTVVEIELTETDKPFPHVDTITLIFNVPLNFSEADR